VPSGEHTVVVWHEVLPNLRQKIVIAETDLQLNFALKGWPKSESPAASSEEMVLVPAGEFVMGADDRQPNERPRRKISIVAFRIDRTEVTNAQFCDFLNAIRRNRDEEGVTWIDLDNPECKIRPGKKRGEFVVQTGFESFPIVCVSWHGAAAYAKWIGKRLPSETEWEKAARGIDGREWPWGSESASGRANLGSSPQSSAAPRMVGSFSQGASTNGCLDMAGNVWEWTTTNLDDKEKIIRGGAFDSPPILGRCAARASAAPALRSNRLGFRCAADSQRQ
jgi:formylglycine-generating enzyme required for sulfatase activity